MLHEDRTSYALGASNIDVPQDESSAEGGEALDEFFAEPTSCACDQYNFAFYNLSRSKETIV
jgi:hypothetical protein